MLAKCVRNFHAIENQDAEHDDDEDGRVGWCEAHKYQRSNDFHCSI